MTTTISRDGAVAVLRIDEGRGNALSFESIANLMRALDDIERDAGVRALVLASASKAFCAGLDLRACSRFDRPTLVKFVDAFEGLFERLLTYSLPVVAAVNGPAIAGGAVIALLCDERVIAPGASIALNEVELGLPFPSMALSSALWALPPGARVEGLMLGKRFGADEAVARAICAEQSDDVDAAALRRARAFTEPGPLAVRAVKQMLRADIVARARADAATSRAAFVDAFLGVDAQARIRALVEKLEAPRR